MKEGTMRNQQLLLLTVFACFACQVSGKTVFRRTEIGTANFKGLSLSPEEIDPNVAPATATHQQVATIVPVDDDDVVPTPTKASSISNNVNNMLQSSRPTTAVIIPVTSAITVAAQTSTQPPPPVKKPDEPTGLGKYCKCTDSSCDCCRSIGIPILPVRSQGCAKIAYLGNEKMSVSLNYGDITLIRRIISAKKAKPICVGLPGGETEFCGRVYGLAKSKDDFKACLGFEVRADDEVETALRVSCFKFGPSGVRIAPADPLPTDDDEDDYDDIFGFGGDDEDDNDYADGGTDNESDAYNDYFGDENTNTPEDSDYGGFSFDSFLAELAEDDQEVNTNNGTAAADTVAATRFAAGRQENLPIENHSEGNELTDGAGITQPSTASEVTTTGPAVNRLQKKKRTTGDTDYTYDIVNGIIELFN